MSRVGGLRTTALSFPAGLTIPRLHLLIAAALLALYVVVAIRPERVFGSYDAWAIWNVKARAIYFHGFDIIRNPIFHHPDYPPLLPVIEAGLLKVFGDTPYVFVAVQGGLLAALLLIPRWKWWTLLIVGVIAVQYALHQYADLFIALMVLISAILYEKKRPLLLGISLGICLFVKNEGMVIALAFLLMQILVERKLPLRTMAALIPFAFGLALYKAWVGAPSEFFDDGSLQRALDLSRQQLLIPYMFATAFLHFNFAVPVVLVISLLKGIRLRLTPLLIVCFLTLVGYWATYTITPLDLGWHLEMSYDRLLFHILPTIVYAVGQLPTNSLRKVTT